MDLGFGKYLSYTLWQFWRQLETVIRTHPSQILSFTLIVLLAVRGGRDLVLPIIGGYRPAYFDVLVLFIAMLTIFTIIWEVLGNQQSNQQVRFSKAILMLLMELDRFANGRDEEPELSKRLDQFLEMFLEVTSNSFGGRRRIVAALMLPESHRAELRLVQSSSPSGYQAQIVVPLNAQRKDTGPASLAFLEHRIVYMPSKGGALTFPLGLADEPDYAQFGLSQINARSPEAEKFRSVLCFPVSTYDGRSTRLNLGVLTFSSKKVDPFLRRDLILGECFSSILAQAFSVARAKATQEVYTTTKPSTDAIATEPSTVDKEALASTFSYMTNLPPHTVRKTLYLRALQLENIRCFERLGLAFEDEAGPFLTTIILGDNAAGKTTILRSIALGLCQESDAVSLIKNLPGTLLRKGAERGSITIHLRSGDGNFQGSIITTIEAPLSGGQEVIRQSTHPTDFPWQNLFVCGYGTQRSSERPSSHEAYEARLAVATLFSDSSDLLNPEIVLLRRDREVSKRLEGMLKQILLLEDPDSGIRRLKSGIELAGPWGSQPLLAVSDGYRSTSQWVLDYLGWQVFAHRFQEGIMDGMLLVDELEQHLHPRWQRYLLQRLRVQFDQTQIIGSTHTPLIAAGVADIERSQVVRLVATATGAVEAQIIAKEYLTGKRADQILGDAFGLITSKSPGSLAKIDRYTQLMSVSRNEAEERELKTLRDELDEGWSSGDSVLARNAEKVVSRVLDQMIDEGRQISNQEREIVDAQVKQRLSELFSTEEEE